MSIQLSAASAIRELLGAIFVLVSITACGPAQAQSTRWPQQPMMQQQAYAAPPAAMPVAQYTSAVPQAYAVPTQAMPAAAYQTPVRQPYFVASRPASPSIQNQYPVIPVEGTPCYQGAPQQQYAPADQWCDPAPQNGMGYSSGNGYGQGHCDSGYGMSNYGMGTYCCPPPVQWFGYAGVLMLDRDDENHRFYSYDSADESYQLLDSQETNFDWASGVEAHVGRMDMCNCTGCEAVYWGLYPDPEYAYAYPSQVSGDLNGIFNFDQLDYNGQPANTYVDGAAVHRLYRTTELHNVEFNRIWNCGGCCQTSCCTTGCDTCYDSCCSGAGSCCGGRGHGCGGGCTFGVLTGFRYLRFEDNISFASDPNDTMFTGEVDELYYNIDTDNDLWGWQFGGFGEKALGGTGVSFTFGAKAGIFLNDADARSTIGGAAGLATINNGPNNGVAWDIESNDDCMATIAELQAGVAWAFCPTWRVRGDYRVIGISGVALPTNQIYQDLRGVQDVALISTNGDIILHGVFVGVERTY